VCSSDLSNQKLLPSAGRPQEVSRRQPGNAGNQERMEELKKTLMLEGREARCMTDAALRRSKELGVLETACVVDAGGFPILLERMDGARITGPQIAWNKAFTAAGHKRSTHLFNQPPKGPALPN